MHDQRAKRPVVHWCSRLASSVPNTRGIILVTRLRRWPRINQPASSSTYPALMHLWNQLQASLPSQPAGIVGDPLAIQAPTAGLHRLHRAVNVEEIHTYTLMHHFACHVSTQGDLVYRAANKCVHEPRMAWTGEPMHAANKHNLRSRLVVILHFALIKYPHNRHPWPSCHAR